MTTGCLRCVEPTCRHQNMHHIVDHAHNSLSVISLIKLYLLLTGTMETSEGELNEDEVTHMSLTISDEAYQTIFITQM